jgi:hypothetical protein
MCKTGKGGPIGRLFCVHKMPAGGFHPEPPQKTAAIRKYFSEDISGSASEKCLSR